MTWKLAHNLAVRHDAIEACWPGTVIGEVGDLKHQTEASDHNPDARGVVHAIDAMTYGDETKAAAILAWCLASTTDLQYVIHDRRIYGRNESNGWKGSAYTGSDPHTDHVHISGKHGSAGRNAATGTGYDTKAEAMSPAGSPCAHISEDDMPLTAADVKTIMTTPVLPQYVWAAPGSPKLISLQTAIEMAGNQSHASYAATQAGQDPHALAAALAPLLPAGQTVTAEVVAAGLAAFYAKAVAANTDDTTAS